MHTILHFKNIHVVYVSFDWIYVKESRKKTYNIAFMVKFDSISTMVSWNMWLKVVTALMLKNINLRTFTRRFFSCIKISSYSHTYIYILLICLLWLAEKSSESNSTLNTRCQCKHAQCKTEHTWSNHYELHYSGTKCRLF